MKSAVEKESDSSEISAVVGEKSNDEQLRQVSQ